MAEASKEATQWLATQPMFKLAIKLSWDASNAIHSVPLPKGTRVFLMLPEDAEPRCYTLFSEIRPGETFTIEQPLIPDWVCDDRLSERRVRAGDN